MGVYIKDMELPKFCMDCFGFNHEYHFCSVTDKDVDCALPDWCPLVEVPLHGRLIDADALIAAHKEVCSRSMKFNLDLAPTVIPAEEDE